MNTETSLSVLVVGSGNMGASHARAYQAIPEFRIAGLVSRTPPSRQDLNKSLGGGLRCFQDFATALAETNPDVVCISTYPDTHADFAIQAMEAGAHVFVEKPLAETAEDAARVAETARRLDRKVVVGYILRHHPAWVRFTEIAHTLGKPLVMRMNLNQQSRGENWNWHKNLMQSLSPIVDCGVHYVDIMCQMTRSRPLRVQAIGARLSEEIAPDQYNYGQLQVVFEDGSVGWYEAGWGPMMSEVAFFVKDVAGPKGCVSIEKAPGEQSDDIASHTGADTLHLHHAEMDENNNFVREDEWIRTENEPDHDELCRREQLFLLEAIQENRDLSDHVADAVNSLRIVLAADRSIREARIVELEE